MNKGEVHAHINSCIGSILMAPHVTAEVGSFRFRISASQSWQITGGKATTLRRMMARCSRKGEAAPHSGMGQCSMSPIKDRPSEDAYRAAPCSGLNRRQFSTMLASSLVFRL